MRAIALLMLFVLRAAPAWAHGDDAGRWTLDPWIVTPLLLSLTLYSWGLAKLRLRTARSASRTPGHRNQRAVQMAAYASGWATLAAALVSPLHSLGERLFSVHMLEHEIIMAVSAPLLVVARPLGVLLWSLPPAARSWLTHAARWKPLSLSWRWQLRPVNATIVHGAVIWIWHLPVLFDAAVANVLVHRLQHVSFLVSALFFWYSLLRTANGGAPVGHLFFTMLHMTLLGALLTLAPRALYVLQTADSGEWGLTALQDQQLAGLLMWVPAGTVYAGAALAFAARWIRSSENTALAASDEAPSRRAHVPETEAGQTHA